MTHSMSCLWPVSCFFISTRRFYHEVEDKNLREVNVVGNTKLRLAAATKIPISGEGPEGSVRASPVWLARTVVIQLVDVAVIRSISAILGTINAGGARQTSTSREVPLTISFKTVRHELRNIY